MYGSDGGQRTRRTDERFRVAARLSVRYFIRVHHLHRAHGGVRTRRLPGPDGASRRSEKAIRREQLLCRGRDVRCQNLAAKPEHSPAACARSRNGISNGHRGRSRWGTCAADVVDGAKNALAPPPLRARVRRPSHRASWTRERSGEVRHCPPHAAKKFRMNFKL